MNLLLHIYTASKKKPCLPHEVSIVPEETKITIGGITLPAALAKTIIVIFPLLPDVRQCIYFIPLGATTLGGL